MKTPFFAKVLSLDSRAMVWMHGHRVKPLNVFFQVITYSGTGRVWLVISLILSLLNQRGISLVAGQTVFLRAMWAALLAWLIGAGIKKLVSRKRPFQAIEAYTSLVTAPIDDSFPSSHASSSVAFFTALLIAEHPWAQVVGLWSMLVTVSRFYLGVHYITDLVAGVFLGIGCAFALHAAALI